MNGQIKELTDTEIRLAFASLCVECAARRLGCTPREMYRRMKRVGLIEKYILRHYGVIHTESRQSVTEDIVACLQAWEERQGIRPAQQSSPQQSSPQQSISPQQDTTPEQKGGTPC